MTQLGSHTVHCTSDTKRSDLSQSAMYCSPALHTESVNRSLHIKGKLKESFKNIYLFTYPDL